VLLESDELQLGSALLRDTELELDSADSAITCSYCSTAHSTSVKCSAYAVYASFFFFMHYALMLAGTNYARYYVYASLLVGQMECQNDSSLYLRDLATATHNCQHYDLRWQGSDFGINNLSFQSML